MNMPQEEANAIVPASKVFISRTTFDLASIEAALKMDFSGTLRMLADAVDAGEIEGWSDGVQGIGFTHFADRRLHLQARIRLAAPPVVYRRCGPQAGLLAAGSLDLDIAVKPGLEEPGGGGCEG